MKQNKFEFAKLVDGQIKSPLLLCQSDWGIQQVQVQVIYLFNPFLPNVPF